MDKSTKIMQVVGILVLVAVGIWIFNSCSKKSSSRYDEVRDKLDEVFAGLEDIRSECEEYKNGSYEDMGITLYGISDKCTDLIETVNDLRTMFQERDLDDGRIPSF